jgi:hypothetical protein
MPGKRKSFFTIGFWGVLLIALSIAGALVLDEISSGKKVEYTIDPDTGSLVQPPAKDTVIAKVPIRKEPDFLPKEIHDSLFSFRIVYDSVQVDGGYWYHRIRSISIYRVADQKKIQTVAPPEPFDVPTYLPAFEVEDMNFDGYADFRALSFMMIRGQLFYDFWLYNPAKGKFETSIALGNLWDAEFDHETKTVTSNQRLVGPFDVINEVYTWEEGKLVLQHREESQGNPFGGEDGDITMIKRIDGKFVERSKHFDTIPITPYGSVIFDWEKLK